MSRFGLVTLAGRHLLAAEILAADERTGMTVALSLVAPYIAEEMWGCEAGKNQARHRAMR